MNKCEQTRTQLYSHTFAADRSAGRRFLSSVYNLNKLCTYRRPVEARGPGRTLQHANTSGWPLCSVKKNPPFFSFFRAQ